MSTSFYSNAAELPREDILKDYWAFLEARNGSLESGGTFAKREAWLTESETWDVRHRGHIDSSEFNRQYASFKIGRTVNEPLLALLGFVKVNASEAYGVEVTNRLRKSKEPSSMFSRIENVLGAEETYHTKILLGATTQFGVARPQGAWRPNLAIRLLVGAIALSPKALFHPIVLGGELGGVFIFNWMLKRVGEVFADQADLRETLERRLIEIMVDEVGHVTFNRMAVGRWGMAIAKLVSGQTVGAVYDSVPEFKTLGLPAAFRDGFDKFDWSSLPAEVRRRAFFA